MWALLAYAGLPAAAEQKETINPVLPDTPELIWGAIAFFLLLVLMWAVLLPPIKKGMRQRDEQIKSDQESAERATIEAEQVRRDYDATLAEAHRDAARIMEEAREAGEARRAEIIGAVEAELGELRQAALAEIETGRQEALVQLRSVVGDLAVSAASKVVQKPLDLGANQATVDAHVNQAGGLA
jgi:F-type H+-transporting ATPase subunit b